MRNLTFSISLILLILSTYSVAKDVSVHISEDATTIKAKDISANIFGSGHEKVEKTYVSRENSESLNPDNSNDAHLLANSIEFELYEISENHNSHTIYESGAGICRGFKSQHGVDLTDSTTYYMGNSSNEYYASIIGANVSDKNGAKNMQYAPVFNINDPNLSKQVQDDEAKYGRGLATRNVKDKTKILSSVICQ
ncbi:hypothetical protein [Pasteurella bettyae]|uniref:DUF8095 domain-containing protein n=1 Tax=Pasteurella bettyae CCUG 2042 TaxID=1095749 RepID=I3DH60_9PAST|nr:hypothetical protein [Pasteurella bettyae]EIJ71053.1 hypothetical protein HMPREF1052_1867 [Pasteurella bettyae CCUG 2042]SUB22241.1 lipoprotein-2 [Pasteurella bettyae]